VVAASNTRTPSFRIMKKCMKTGSFSSTNPVTSWAPMPAATIFKDTWSRFSLNSHASRRKTTNPATPFMFMEKASVFQ